MARRSGIFWCQRKTSISLSIQKARFSSAVRCSITAKTCKKAALKSRIPTLWLTAPAAKVSQFSKPAQLIGGAAGQCGNSAKLHLHDFGFFVLEMIIDRFNESIGELLNLVLHVA